jgi:hypothetical protein
VATKAAIKANARMDVLWWAQVTSSQRAKLNISHPLSAFCSAPAHNRKGNRKKELSVSPYPPSKVMLTTNPLFSNAAHGKPNSGTGQLKLPVRSLPSTHTYTTSILLKVRAACRPVLSQSLPFHFRRDVFTSVLFLLARFRIQVKEVELHEPTAPSRPLSALFFPFLSVLGASCWSEGRYPR